MTRFAFPKPEPLKSELEAFRDAVLGLDSRVVTMPEGLVTVSVAEALIESANSGETVSLNAPREKEFAKTRSDTRIVDVTHSGERVSR